MICNKCGKQTSSRICEHCGNAVGAAAPVGGLATLRIIARQGFRLYITVDDQEYVLKPKQRQIDIPIVPGVHKIHLSFTSRTEAKLSKAIGMAAQFVGAAVGSTAIYVWGSAEEGLSRSILDKGAMVKFDPGDLVETKVKANFWGQLVEDDK